MRVSGLREQTDEELRQLLDESARELVDLKLKKGWGDGSTQPLRLRTLRRDIARIRTVIRERELKRHG
jgi:large subunit ribosomal protein L29